MADIALGSLGKIVEVALKIKEAVETVKQNESECREIQSCVTRVSALLKRLDETTEMMRDDLMRNTMEDLAVSLDRALELVMECQQKHRFRRFLGAGDMAKELQKVNNDIVRKLMLGNFATNVQTTVVLTNIQSAGAPPPPPPNRVVIDGFIQFSLSELKAAAMDFSDKNVIGIGGSAIVYKGILHDGQVVAIKKYSSAFLFRNTSNIIYNSIDTFIDLKHENIIRPLGYCHEIIMVLVRHEGRFIGAEEHQLCFVEEFMPKGSLAHIMNGPGLIDWFSRFKIIQGTAQGLRYLHDKHIIHMDLKPSNILLDPDMNPRICDFGVAKKLDDDDHERIIDMYSIVGTVTYMAPEYITQGTMSTKCDVYAFGIIVLQTIDNMCRKKQQHEDFHALVDWALKAREDATGTELFNTSLCDQSELMQIKRCVEVGLACTEHQAEDRPTMADVLVMLNGEKETPSPKQPAGVPYTLVNELPLS